MFRLKVEEGILLMIHDAEKFNKLQNREFVYYLHFIRNNFIMQ